MPQRLEALTLWVQNVLGQEDLHVMPASSDASFRRYFRVTSRNNATTLPLKGGQEAASSLIVMDAPPDKEDIHPFMAISDLLVEIGLNAPQVLAVDEVQGFLLLSDLGSQPYLGALNAQTVDQLYGDALDALLTMQAKVPRDDRLPPYDEALLLREMELFREWYLRRYLNLSLTAQQQAILDQTFHLLAQAALAQPRVFVHRDYHSRNLMVTAQNNPGILDFQDAVVGPVTYDLASLLRDCYVAWPRQQVEGWALEFLHRAADAGVFERNDNMSDETLLRWFDWMGVQRHLKASGIFARLKLRDGKDGYLADIPRTLGYVRDVCGRYAELKPLGDFLAGLAH